MIDTQGYIKRGAALIDTQVFGFRYSSVLTPRRTCNAMPGHRVTTTALTTTGYIKSLAALKYKGILRVLLH